MTKSTFSFFLILVLNLGFLFAQKIELKRNSIEDSVSTQGQVYNRPFILFGKSPASVGGYAEANTNYFSEDGVSDGFSMEFRRFNIFIYSSIGPRIKFISELEFEHGVREINLETAQIDFEFMPSLVFRGGIVLCPVGGFNLNHDSPKWEFVERPMVSTEIIPSTLSDVGMGLNGKMYFGNILFTYDMYVVNGLGAGIILNEAGKTHFQGGKHAEMFAWDNNNSPSGTARLAIKHPVGGEFGISYLGGVYNDFKVEGVQINRKRAYHLMALDFSTGISELDIVGEFALNFVQIPQELKNVYASSQWGGFVDFVYPILKKKILRWENARLNVALRLEMTDLNVGKFTFDDSNKFDTVSGISAGLSFRPSSATIFRVNYLYRWHKDLIGNPFTREGGIQFGIATYF